MKKLAFIGNSEQPQKLLDTFRKMTPGRSGVWGNLVGTGNLDEADCYAVIDKLTSDYSHIPENKCVFLGAHPETLKYYQDMDGFNALAKFDCKHTLGFLEWWITYDYDYLSKLQPMPKTKLLGTIVSNSSSDDSHRVRREFLERMCSQNPGILDIYGRIRPFGSLVSHYKGACGQYSVQHAGDYWSGKEPVYEQYKYMLEFDNVGEHYFSERILDCMLLWAMPIYWGGRGVHKVLPATSFKYLDINGHGDDVRNIINSRFYEEHLPELSEARHILLNEVQVWPKVHKAIFGTFR